MMGTTLAAAPQRPAEKDNGTKPTSSALDQAIEQTIRSQSLQWKSADTGEELNLSISHVRKLFANPTKSGKMPTDRDCWLFLQLCKARGLNPYVGDAFLVGYDERDGNAKFSLITAHQALLKRAEASGKKKGMQSGVLVIDDKSKQLTELPGDFFLDGDTLVGAWCKVYRSDWELPIYERVKLSTYNKGYSRWAADPAGMIVKVAEASAHRLAFPAETGGMYVREEADAMQHEHGHEQPQASDKQRSRSEQIADELAAKFGAKRAQEPESQLPSREPEDIPHDDPGAILDDQTMHSFTAAGIELPTAQLPQMQPATETTQPEAKRGPGRPPRPKQPDPADIKGPASPAWAQFNDALGRMDDEGIKVIRVKAGVAFTPWTDMRGPQLEDLTQRFMDHLAAREIAEADEQFAPSGA